MFAALLVLCRAAREEQFLEKFDGEPFFFFFFFFFLAHFYPSVSITGENSSLPLVPFPNDLAVTDARCSLAALDLDLLSNLSLFRISNITSRFVARLRASFAADTKTFPNSIFARVDNTIRPIVFSDISFQTKIEIPQFGDDESFNLTTRMQENQIRVSVAAMTSTGVVRAFSLVLQLLVERSRCFPIGLNVKDKPAHAWRGLMADTARRFVDLDGLKRLCSGLEMARMNVLHLHLTDDQGWRFESRIWTTLQQKGTLDGKYYTQDNLKELVAYCAVGGVRVVPEIDMPGHCGAALFALPNLAPDHYPKTFVTEYGIHDYALDFSRSFTQVFVRDVLNEVMSVFPDMYVHTGGDEVRWPAFSNRTLGWMAQRNLTASNLQKFVQERYIFPVVLSRGRLVMGWTEIWSRTNRAPLPKGAAVQWWSSVSLNPDTVNVVSAGWYLDQILSAEDIYSAPFFKPSDAGGEACAWSEGIGSNLELRIFPGLLALAEVLWRGPENLLSMNSLLFRTFVQDIGTMGSPVTGLRHRETYVSSVKQLLSNDTLVVDLLIPTSVWVPLLEQTRDVMDAARSTSPSLHMLIWLAKAAGDREKFDPTKPATKQLVSWLSDLALSTPGSFGPNLERHRSSLSADAATYLDMIRTLTASSTDSRISGFFEGTDFFAGVFSADRFSLNGLKLIVEPVLVSRIAVLSSLTTSTGATSDPGTDSTRTTAPTGAPLLDNWVGIVIGSVVVVVLFGGLVVALLIWRARMQRHMTRKAPLAPIVSFDENLRKHISEPILEDEQYADYLVDEEGDEGIFRVSNVNDVDIDDDDDDDEDDDLFVKRGSVEGEPLKQIQRLENILVYDEPDKKEEETETVSISETMSSSETISSTTVEEDSNA